eukprot:COSAG05_NODE_2148_length_3476_cov_4.365709_7_plen_154_part_00
MHDSVSEVDFCRPYTCWILYYAQVACNGKAAGYTLRIQSDGQKGSTAFCETYNSPSLLSAPPSPPTAARLGHRDGRGTTPATTTKSRSSSSSSSSSSSHSGYGSGSGRIEEFSVSRMELLLVTDCAAVYGDMERTDREMERKPLIARNTSHSI